MRMSTSSADAEMDQLTESQPEPALKDGNGHRNHAIKFTPSGIDQIPDTSADFRLSRVTRDENRAYYAVSNR